MKLSKIVHLAGMTALAITLLTVNAYAESDWQKNHPRRAQVVKRDKKQKKNIENAEKNGKLTSDQAKKLMKEDNAIRTQEQADAAANGGHITKSEQRDLNREENQVNREMKRDERRNAQKAQGSGQNSPGTTPSTGTTPVTTAPVVTGSGN